jgi:hypothetical protein
MTALAVATTTAPAVSPLKCFRLRCWGRAYLYAAGEIDLIAAVDALQEEAEAAGFIDEIGQDAIQAMLAEAFFEVKDQLS